MRQTTTICPRDCYNSRALIGTVDDHGRILSMQREPRHTDRGLCCQPGHTAHERFDKYHTMWYSSASYYSMCDNLEVSNHVSAKRGKPRLH